MGTSSPSSRRAWIEIFKIFFISTGYLVALLAEGVDRNYIVPTHILDEQVALLAEGVDRNSPASGSIRSSICRPPRGGRG